MGKDKALLDFEGESLLQHTIHFCQSICDEIIVSSNFLEHKVEGIQIVSDEVNNCGPLGGIYSCLKKSENKWNFVISVDAPFIEKDFVSFLYGQKEDSDAVVPLHKIGKEPLIALYHKKILPIIETQLTAGDYKMQFLLQKIHTNYVDAKDWIKKYPRLFYNINYPEDMKKWKEN